MNDKPDLAPAPARRQVTIGRKLRERRRKLDLTLDAVAQRVGVTPSFVSDVERGRASPSVQTLLAMCDALGISVGTLFAGPDSAVVRRDEWVPIQVGGVGMHDFQLSPRSQTRLQVVWTEIDPAGSSGKEPYRFPTDLTFLLVLEGEVVVVLEDETVSLSRGDCITYNSQVLHSLRNASETKKAVALFVLIPSLATV